MGHWEAFASAGDVPSPAITITARPVPEPPVLSLPETAARQTPERQLLLALLALGIADKDREWIFGNRLRRVEFEATCEGLELDAGAIRAALRRRWPSRRAVLLTST